MKRMRRSEHPTSVTTALSAPPHRAAAIERVKEPGVCGGCGLATAYACKTCQTVHFCSTGCLERARHTNDCGKSFCKAVDLPCERLFGCWLNAHLISRGRFALRNLDEHSPCWALLPSRSYGLKKLCVDQGAAKRLALLVTSPRDEPGFLKIGDISYPGYHGYNAIPGELNSEEQARVTSQLARKGKGRDHDQKRGLQYALDHCRDLKKLVDQVCEHLGGC